MFDPAFGVNVSSVTNELVAVSVTVIRTVSVPAAGGSSTFHAMSLPSVNVLVGCVSVTLLDVTFASRPKEISTTEGVGSVVGVGAVVGVDGSVCAGKGVVGGGGTVGENAID